MAALPLAGIRVLDLSRVLAGPLCCQVLADLGADVVKVERPGSGDDTRHWGPPYVGPGGLAAYFAACNRNKRSLALDLATQAGRAVLEDLVRAADVLVENFLPEVQRRFGLEPARLRALNPRLVACSLSGFGRGGPWADRPGYDLSIQALSGLMAVTGEPEGVPVKVGVAITDVVAGLFAAVAILAGLRGRDLGQPAPALDLALLDCTLASLVNLAQNTLVSGQPPARYGNAHPQIVPYQAFATADGQLVVAVGNDGQWRRFCDAADLLPLAADPRFQTNPDRVRHRADLLPLLEEALAGRTTAQWQQALAAADVPCAAVLTLDAALHLPSVEARRMVAQVTDAAGHTYPLLTPPWRMVGEDPPAVAPPPRLGQHTAQVLAQWLDYPPDRVAALLAAGICQAWPAR